MRLPDLVGYLDEYLAIHSITDAGGAHNGLQVDGRSEIRRVAVAVDACIATITGALECGADLLIVHHGLLWGPTAPITGAYYRRLALLLKNDLPLYSCHLPLDAHPEVGNNHVLARQMGLEPAALFGAPGEAPIGVIAEAAVRRDELAQRLAVAVGAAPLVLATGPEVARRIAIVTGGAGTYVTAAAAAGCDTLVTGEGPHHTYFLAEESGVNLIYGGHYATETVGVRALAQRLNQQFGLQTQFLDHPTGL